MGPTKSIFDSVGMPSISIGPKSAQRDPEFRSEIIRFYEHKCAMCGFNGRLGCSDFALEAAHIRWHAEGGPDDPRNGLLFCSIHHKALDRGAIGLTSDCHILVSQHVHGGSRVTDLITGLAGRSLNEPVDLNKKPAEGFIDRHRREVFRGQLDQRDNIAHPSATPHFSVVDSFHEFTIPEVVASLGLLALKVWRRVDLVITGTSIGSAESAI